MKEVFKALILFIGSFIAVNSFLKLKKGINQTFDQMNDVSAYLQKKISKYNKEDVLIAIDIDLTLIQPEHPALYVPNVRKHLKYYKQIQKAIKDLGFNFDFKIELVEKNSEKIEKDIEKLKNYFGEFLKIRSDL